MNINRFGSQEVEIAAVRLLNLQGGAASSIVSGAGLVIELDYKTKRAIEYPKASVGINLSDGTVCFDTSTDVGGLEIPTLQGVGTIRLRIDRLDLAGGEYFVSVGLYERDWEYTYDAHTQAYRLSVVGIGSGKGMLNPPVKWDIRSATRHSSGDGSPDISRFA